MATITEDYVSFETSKLLKEKGFDEECFALYNPDSILIQSGIRLNNIQVGRVKGSYSAPTLQMAMKWLREVHNIYISVQPDFPSDKDYKMCWCWSVSILHEDCISTKGYQCYIETYEEATEAAIKYSLKNLI